MTTRISDLDKADQLARCAFQLFSEKGINRVNMDQIAKAAGVTKGSIYHHFSSKKEVILSACECYYRDWRRHALKEIKKGKTCLEQLERVIKLSVRSCLLDRQKRVFTLEILTLSLYDDDVKESWAGFYKAAHVFYMDLVQQAIAATEISPTIRKEGVKFRVDALLRTMEGIKQEAHFNEEIRNNVDERLICQELLRLVTH